MNNDVTFNINVKAISSKETFFFESGSLNIKLTNNKDDNDGVEVVYSDNIWFWRYILMNVAIYLDNYNKLSLLNEIFRLIRSVNILTNKQKIR